MAPLGLLFKINYLRFRVGRRSKGFPLYDAKHETLFFLKICQMLPWSLMTNSILTYLLYSIVISSLLKLISQVRP